MMRITGVTNPFEIYNRQSTVHSRERIPRAQEKQDYLTLSTKAKEYQTAFKAMSQVPDIRDDIVNRIQRSVDSGTYNVTAEDVAGRMLSNVNFKA